jgi:hypothetical protein
VSANPVLLAAAAAAAIAGVLVLVLLFRWDGRWAVAAWTATLFFVPVWVGVQAGIYITALTAITVVCILSTAERGIRWVTADTLMTILFAAILVAFLVAGATWGHVLDSLTGWLVPYVWGRLILNRANENWIAACISVAALVAATLSIVEFLSGFNIFHLIPGAGSSNWGGQQIRAELPRSEGAFGHSIALGGSLALASAFVLVVRWPVWARAAALALIATGAAFTFSRIGLIGLALTVVLSVVFLGRQLGRGVRIAASTILGAGAVVALPFLVQVFGDAGSEAQGSAEYRLDLVPLVDLMVPLGLSPGREVLATGEDYFGGFRSIDSALILTGLRFGLVPLAIVVMLALLALVVVLRGRGNPAAVAVVAQLPALGTVALITQYAVFVWFAAGLAVASYTLWWGRSKHPGTDHQVQPVRELTGVT